MTTVQTVTGPVDPADLGRTLVHEHIRISYAGEELDPTYSWDRAETVARAVDKMGELLDAGFRTFVDPCPIELGRDPELYAEISSRSGMRIVCTTGFYTEHLSSGLPFYWRARDPEEIEKYKKFHDPLQLWQKRLTDEGVINEEQIAALDAEAKAEADAAVKFAEESPLPDKADIFSDVYYEVDRQTPAGRTGKHFFND